MAKLCTDKNQSHRLEKMGVTGADMFGTDNGGAANFPICASDGEVHYYKAWSLPALIDLLPDVIWTENKLGKWFYSYHILKDQVEYGSHTESSTWSVMISSPQGELVDAVFFMLCWLVENGHLKFNKED